VEAFRYGQAVVGEGTPGGGFPDLFEKRILLACKGFWHARIA